MECHERVPSASHLPPGDLITGAASVAEFLFGDKKRVRSVYRLAETTSIPIFKVGVQLSARRSRLAEWLAGLESEAAGQKHEAA